MKCAVTSMKKYTAYILASLLFSFISSNSWAAYSSINKSTVTRMAASASVPSGFGTIDLSVGIKLVSNNSNFFPASISWTIPANLFQNGTKWMIADRYLYITSTMSVRGGAIQIYTDNTQMLGASGFSFVKYELALTTTAFGISVSTTGLYPTYNIGFVASSGPAIPLAWRVSSGTFNLASIELNGLNTVMDAKGNGHIQDSKLGADGKPISGYYPWLFMAEYANAFNNANGGILGDYSKVQKAGLGLQTSEGAFNPDPDIYHSVYLAADFSNALDDTNYRALIIVEAFKE